ncbi:hypothetical protein, partial [Streptomyces rimosus]|uniref:hypothetical protein n=1 Tax=Streptomyces rimosus TaxID=1927 RepID=UPI000A50B865
MASTPATSTHLSVRANSSSSACNPFTYAAINSSIHGIPGVEGFGRNARTISNGFRTRRYNPNK